jgi:hypothetical protein
MIEDVFTDKKLARKCGSDAARSLAARKPGAVQLLAAELSPNVAFMKTYHARYRHEVERCICRKSLLVCEPDVHGEGWHIALMPPLSPLSAHLPSNFFGMPML